MEFDEILGRYEDILKEEIANFMKDIKCLIVNFDYEVSKKSISKIISNLSKEQRGLFKNKILLFDRQ